MGIWKVNLAKFSVRSSVIFMHFTLDDTAHILPGTNGQMSIKSLFLFLLLYSNLG